MSEIIFLQGDRPSMASLLNKCEQGATKASSIQSGSYGLSWSAGADGYFGGFCENAIGMAKEAAVLFEKAYLTLSKCEPYWKTVPDNLRKIDAKKKGDKSNWIERQAYQGGRDPLWWTAGTISTLTSLFTGKNRTGEVVYLGPYLYLRDRYDWSNTHATEEDIRKAIEEGAKDERGIGIDRSIDEKLHELYDKTEIIGTKKILLEPHMGDYPLRQGVYPNGDILCCCTAYATGISVVTGEPCYPPSVGDNRGNNQWSSGHASGWYNYNPTTIYEGLQRGEPFVLGYIYDYRPDNYNDADHWVCIVGIREGADSENIQFEDFIAIDPASGEERRLNECYKFNPNRVVGGRMITK